METSPERMKEVLDLYFRAWQTQDSDLIASLFTEDGIYRVKPFGIEEYFGREKIRGYWHANPVSGQSKPQPELLNYAFATELCFAEWQNHFISLKHQLEITTKGILLLEFKDGLIKELREHYLSDKKPL